MGARAFRIAKYQDFLNKSDEYLGDKTFDTESRIATIYGRRKYEYEVKDGEDVNQLIRRGFVEGREIEVYDSW